MSYITFLFISTLFLILIFYNIYFKFFFDWQARRLRIWVSTTFITGGLFIVNFFLFKRYFDLQELSFTIWYPVGVTLLMFFMRGLLLLILNPINNFRSTKEDNPQSISPIIQYKKVSKSDDNKIATYPRITIHDLELERLMTEERIKTTNLSQAAKELYNTKHIIFDSSDFIVINEIFGSFRDYEESFSVGRHIKIKDENLLIERVQVDLMKVYDDYSGIFGHTDVYEGKDVPYNIQIIVFVRRVKTQNLV